MTDEAKRFCTGCKFGIHIDFGYSNYTVEGTTFTCAKKLHPEGEFDEFYGEDKRLEFAEQCSGYEQGEGVWMDVDGENDADLTPEQRAVWEMQTEEPSPSPAETEIRQSKKTDAVTE